MQYDSYSALRKLCNMLPLLRSKDNISPVSSSASMRECGISPYVSANHRTASVFVLG